MAIGSAMDKSKSGDGKIPASCPISGKRMMLDDKRSSSSRNHSDEDEDDDDEELDFQGRIFPTSSCDRTEYL